MKNPKKNNKIIETSGALFNSLKKDFLGESKIKFKKQNPEIIKSNTYELIKIISEFDHKLEIDAGR